MQATVVERRMFVPRLAGGHPQGRMGPAGGACRSPRAGLAMSDDGSVSQWIDGLKAGNDLAAQQVWERYFARLTALAYERLRGTPRRVADEEDVALSAFDTFCRGARQGRFPKLNDRDDLWRLLVHIAEGKIHDQLKHERRQKRGGGNVSGDSVWQRGNASTEVHAGLDALPGPEPTPAFAATIAEECRRLLALLGDDLLRSVAVLKMEGYTNEEVAKRLGCVVQTVGRKLRLIRQLWAAEVAL
jgi:DNA-directed RNA polymerase specialized sigma24 family protein